MTSLKQVFAVIGDLKKEGIVDDYAIGGAMAVLFYAEPARTYDLDVFVLLPPSSGPLILLDSLYAWMQQRGFQPKAEHVIVHGVPVQLLPAHNRLAAEAVRDARSMDYEGVPVRVMTPEHLVALSLEAGGLKRRERAAALIEIGAVEWAQLTQVLARHGLSGRLPPGWDVGHV